MPTEIETTQPERRRHRRFTMTLELRYELEFGQKGVGEVVNMSTGGLLFLGDTTFPVGALIEADLAWPYELESGQQLELRVHGMIRRSDSSGTAVVIGKYEFRRVPQMAEE